MARISRKWVVVLLILLVWVAGEMGLEALKDKKFVATVATGPSFISQATSGPPLQVASSAVVANLNADLLDGLSSAAFAAAAHTHPGSDVVSAVAQALNAANADTLDGLDSSAFATLGSNSFTGDQTVSGTVTATGFVGDGSGLTNIQAGQIQGNFNPNQVALLRWYAANESGAAFAVGNFPRGVAFDGANLWVANTGDSTVTKLRASDGASLGTFTVGSFPSGVAFDGANIWVANQGSASVTKLRASDGANLGTFAVGLNPIGVAFDGANIWTANHGSDTVTKLRASDGAVLGTFPVGNFPRGVAFDGANIWVANSGNGTVSKLRASDGATLGTFAVGSQPVGVAFDGANMWVANAASDTVRKL